MDCVWYISNERIKFWELSNKVLSGLAHALNRREQQLGVDTSQKKEYYVNSISLFDLLERYNAPQKIDYLSMDTEGTELEILRNFDFNKYEFSVITIEHSFTKARGELENLLTANGYTRVFERISYNEDWYIHSSLNGQDFWCSQH